MYRSTDPFRLNVTHLYLPHTVVHTYSNCALRGSDRNEGHETEKEISD